MTTANDINYKQIADSLYFCILNEKDTIPGGVIRMPVSTDFKIIIDKNTSCFNATRLCRDFKKRIRDWTHLESSQLLIDHYKIRGLNLIGNYYGVRDRSKKIAGQYVCKELLLDVAKWISPDVLSKCQIIIDSYFAHLPLGPTLFSPGQSGAGGSEDADQSDQRYINLDLEYQPNTKTLVCKYEGISLELTDIQPEMLTSGHITDILGQICANL